MVSTFAGRKLHILLAGLLLFATSVAFAASYKAAFLTSDQTGTAPNIDPNLQNAWGISFSPTGPFWISDNRTGKSTIYDTNGVPNSLVVTVPPAATGVGTPTGTVFNGTTGFVVKKGASSGAALFLFDTEDGTISGWNPAVDGTNALIAVDNSSTGSQYTGMELANNGTANFLYVANLFTASIEVYDSTFKLVTLSGGTFTDPRLPAGFAPYNIRNIKNKLYVAYAKQDATKHRVTFGAGLGLIDIFDLNGKFLKRLTSKGQLNAPWGLALAPASFGTFANALLVGNLGDGKITAYDAATGAVKGQLSNAAGTPIAISGLWALSFGNGGMGGKKNVLYFTSGPGGYAHGRFGSITAQP